MAEFIIGMFVSFIFILGISGIAQTNYEKHPETSKEYREGYCKALNGERIEGTLCVDKENKTLYIFKTNYEQ